MKKDRPFTLAVFAVAIIVAGAEAQQTGGSGRKA
jgi:hypothetical protein